MRSLARLLLLIAALAYGAMPITGMSAMAMPAAHAMDAGGDLSEPVAASPTMVDVDCPHAATGLSIADAADRDLDHSSKPMKTVWHCAACLTLPAETVLADSGKPARAAEASALLSRLVSQLSAPATPPPRS
ncbi:hypothetical protein QWE_12948 [Agrobacterium albertimagni AOL15]|uniref:Uncharacterized protein n=1 Tax=Agrobacterium albertimagni AOL15 TaxID=1156935 RepID=K2QVC3_9HYPH|nr:hypothetical protein [Agrobacterium albertimagni]EKF59162.1 hypothetical protein QWE_12948 [Agrobacterium albertimagni AOL15]